jgi:hypothetical protein
MGDGNRGKKREIYDSRYKVGATYQSVDFSYLK